MAKSTDRPIRDPRPADEDVGLIKQPPTLTPAMITAEAFMEMDLAAEAMRQAWLNFPSRKRTWLDGTADPIELRTREATKSDG